MAQRHGVALNVIVLGPPGAGKGTQAERLAQQHRVPKISTGDILREAVQTGTETGGLAKATMDGGNLVGDAVMIAIVRDRLSRNDAKPGFVLDGFPRTVVQASALDEMMDGRGPLLVIDIAVPEDVLVRRLATRRICGNCGSNALVEWTTTCGKCGGHLIQRSDDGDDIVRERLKVYHRATKSLVDYYAGRETFRTIDGNQPPDVVTEAIDCALKDASGASEARL